jgi:hypothetical protein
MATPARTSRVSRNAAPTSAGLDEKSMFALAVGLALAVYCALRFIQQHEALAISAAVLAAVVAAAGVFVIARLRDRRAARLDPPRPGIILGTVKRDGLLARPRPFRIPWSAFHQHVIVDGPTGAGKTFTYIEPVLRGFCATKKPSGIFYLDGKGDRVDQRPGVRFDHVFCPEDPAASAYWNPLAGPDPVMAASQFAAALFPEAVESGANFYEAKAVYAITKVAPAMAFTGFGVAATAEGGSALPEAVPLERRLIAAGLSLGSGARWASTAPDAAERQLAYLSGRADTSAAALERAIAQDTPAPAGYVSGSTSRTWDVTPADLNRVLFGAGKLVGLVEALDGCAATGADAATIAQLRHDVAALAGQDDKDRAAVFQNLQNRLGYFLTPPFLELCSRSDFGIADVAEGRKVGFLLPTGSFPAAAKPLGRIALAQFKNAVLASPPGIRKIAVLDEFHNFVSDDWGPFLNQARSRDGAAIMAMQSLADLPHHKRQAMLANARTVVVTPGVSPEDAEYWAKVFGQEVRERRSYSYEQRSLLSARPRAHVRVDQTEEFRWTPSEIAELHESYALIRVTNQRTIYPVAKVRVERG